jgi:NADH-quinone oxidoreductase subunit L
LKREMPLIFWLFLTGALALAGLPPTDGFASKEFILNQTWSSPIGGPGLWAAGLAGVFLTSLYTFRMFFLVFFGPTRQAAGLRNGKIETVPLLCLATFTILAAAVNWPASWGGVQLVSNFLTPTLPAVSETSPTLRAGGAWLSIVGVCVSLAGIPVAWRLTIGATASIQRQLASAPANIVRRFWFAGWGFDWLYENLLVRPVLWLARINRNDFFDSFYRAIGGSAKFLNAALSLTQTGRVRWYAAGVALGAIGIGALVILSR